MARDYGAVMYQCKFPAWNKILSQINEEDIYIDENDSIFGYEYEPHVTVVYGFHPDIDHKGLIEDISKFKPTTIDLIGVSGFENEKFDVLKIDIDPKPLVGYREMLLGKYDNTQDFEGYNPHITLAYLKKGTGKKYHNKKPCGQIVCNEIKYSSPQNHNIYLNL